MIMGVDYGIFWLCVAVVLALIEVVTMAILTVWFAIGSVFAMFVAMIGGTFTNQCIVFILTSAVMLIFTRPVAKKYINSKVQKTNADSLIGQNAIVIEAIDNLKSTGQVKISGQYWSSRSVDEAQIELGTVVKIEMIKGNKLIVRKTLEER